MTRTAMTMSAFAPRTAGAAGAAFTLPAIATLRRLQAGVFEVLDKAVQIMRVVADGELRHIALNFEVFEKIINQFFKIHK